MQKNNLWLGILIGGLVGAIALVTVYIGYLALLAPEDTLLEESPGGILRIEPPRPMPDFMLTDQHDRPIHLSDLRGQPVLLTFGFTHCPDVCPLTLQEMRGIRTSLDARADALHYVFISVDGQRDTPERLRDYFELRQVDTFLIGMTGTEDAVRELGANYGLYFSYGEVDVQGNYPVDHTPGLFLLNSDGFWIRRYAFETQRIQVVEDLHSVLNSEADS